MDKLRKKFLAAQNAAAALHALARDEERELTDEERQSFEAHLEEARQVRAQLDRAAEDAEALLALGSLPADSDSGSLPAGPSPAVVSAGSLGTQVIRSEHYQNLLASYGGSIPASVQVQMPRVGVDISAALITDPGLAQPDTRVAPSTTPVVDLFSAITVIPNSPQKTTTFSASWTDAADVVAEGALKPEASLSWSSTDIMLKTIAQHVPITNQALSHENSVRATVDGFLVNGVRARMAAQVATALASAATQVQAFDTDLRTTTRKAITKAQLAQAQLGGGTISVLMSALDAEKLDLEAMYAALYAPGEGPQQVSGVWRTNLVVSASLPQGFLYAGDLRQIELRTAGGISVTTGWVNDQFVKNTLTLLAETEAEASVFVGPLLVKAATAAA